MSSQGHWAVDPDAPLESLVGKHLALLMQDPYGNEEVLLVGVGAPPRVVFVAGPTWVSVIHGVLGRNATAQLAVPGFTSLREFVSSQWGKATTRAMLVPRIRWGSVRNRRGPAWGALLCGFVVLVVVASVLGRLTTVDGFLSFLPLLMGGGASFLYVKGYQKYVVNSVLDSPTSKRDFVPVDIVVRRLVVSGSAPGRVISSSSSSPSSHRDARRSVEELKDTYAKLMTDMVYRIENAALFDSAVPLTREFELLLMRWDDEAANLDSAGVSRLASELELAFNTARKNAERLGLGHLPVDAQADAARAAKAARLAAEATSPGEKEAATATVTRLLSSLALYYLPTPEEAPKMLAGGPRSIEPN
ncbi:MAG: hypothetical protein Q4D79_03855 [Propionibacteriaceae bacterium]|nr:hypothetical protein [Propionibacteriaceae bacterium]